MHEVLFSICKEVVQLDKYLGLKQAGFVTIYLQVKQCIDSSVIITTYSWQFWSSILTDELTVHVQIGPTQQRFHENNIAFITLCLL